ncbi:hypothetical protein ACNF42_02135 [Cuniculiplasma sp. SKW3]|uniref:hypothetical protein n=1 Tax=Cuniculiplasma sp. SKW3 TaxID=3400170 RepID=UPI003FD2D2AE
MSEDNIENFLRDIQIKSISMFRYSIKRAYGIYYSIWAIAIFYFIFLSPLLFINLQDSVLGDIVEALGFTAVLLAATYFTFMAFSRSSRSKELENIFHIKRIKLWANLYRWFNVIFISAYSIAIIYLINAMPIFLSYIIFYMLLLMISFFLLLTLKVSLGRIPLEGYVASFSYMFSSLSSTLIFALFHPAVFPLMAIQILWAPTEMGWIFAGMYSFYTAPVELRPHE